MAISQLAGMRP